MRDAFSHCAELVRNADHDRFIATLFAPAQCRDSLHALYAFNVELAHIRNLAREAMPGEIRLQWWREVVERQREAEAGASPVAAAILHTIERHRLRVDAILALIEARRFDLYNEPIATIAAFEDYAFNTSSVLIEMAAQILGADAAAAAWQAGIAYALNDLLIAFPKHAARRQLYLPLELLARHGVDAQDVFAGRLPPALNDVAVELRALARRHLDTATVMLRGLPGQALPALLPVAPVRSSLDRLERSDIFAPNLLPQWRRQWLIWRAARRWTSADRRSL
jgi:15-cis-phytoene synthase